MNFNEFINNHNITLDCTLIEDTTAIAPQKGDNGTIKWSVTIHCGNRKAEFDYTMGSAYVKYIDKSLPTLGIYKWLKQYIQPDLYSVLNSIQTDAIGADMISVATSDTPMTA